MPLNKETIDDFAFYGNDWFRKNVMAELKKYSKLEHMKVNTSILGIWC